MNRTELFFFDENGDCKYYAEIGNAWRGAMAIWRYLEEKYFPLYRPEHLKHFGLHEGMTDEEFIQANRGTRPTRLVDPAKAKEVWDLVDDERLTVNERIVMATTFDQCLVKAETIPHVLCAFRSFGSETSLNEQADAIEKAIKEHPDITAVGWNQTSVCADSWASAGPVDDNENGTAYNWKTGDKHWWIDEEFKELFRQCESGGST